MQRRCPLPLTGFCAQNHNHDEVENAGNVVVLVHNCKLDKKSINYAQLKNYLSKLKRQAESQHHHVIDCGVAANVGQILRGHVYIQFGGREEAQAARDFFQGQTVDDQYPEIDAQITAMRDIEGGTCTRYKPGNTGSCKYGRNCDYIHLERGRV